MAKKSLVAKSKTIDVSTVDSFVNFVAKLGLGTDNQQGSSSYSLSPMVSRLRITLEAAYRSSWIVGQVVDTVAEDMTREGITINSTMDPDESKNLQSGLTNFAIWQSLCSNTKWARLYGGSIAVVLTEGADYSKPLNIETIGKGKFKGLLVLDRWQIDPTFGDLVTEVGIDMGKPKYYNTLPGCSSMPAQKIHYTRVIRFDGIELPYYQKLAENLWGLSVVERMWDRLLAFDSATVGASQMLYKAYLRVIGIDGLRDALATGGAEEQAVIKQFHYIRLMQSMEGITLLDLKDKFETHQYSFAGVSDVLIQFGQQISGATGIPLVRLFGQSPAGLSSTGESDLRNYYDHIKKLQNSHMRRDVYKLLQVMNMSINGKPVPKDFDFEFNSLWQMSEKEKADIAQVDVTTMSAALGSGLITKKIGMKELSQQSRVTGRFTNITEVDIEAAVEEPLGHGGIGGEGDEDLAELQNKLDNIKEFNPGSDDFEALKNSLKQINTNREIKPKMKIWDSIRWFIGRFMDKLAPVPMEQPVKVGLIGDKVMTRKEALASALKGIQSVTDAFEESEHPRGQEGSSKGGQFVKKGSSGQNVAKGGEATKTEVKLHGDDPRKKSASEKTTTQAQKAEELKRTKSTQSFIATKRDDKGNFITSQGKALPAHVAGIKIPPAWTNVIINPDPKGALLICGYDTKGRRQSVYSEKHGNIKTKAKFARIEELNKKLPSIMHEIDAKINKSEEALITKLIMNTGIRPGSDIETQSKVKAYGATTLEGRHVTVKDDKVVLSFIGKKGVQNNIPIEDKKMANVLLSLKNKAGEDGKIFHTEYSSLLHFTASLDGGKFKTKDFRTLVGTKTAMTAVAGMKPPTNEKEYKKAVKEVAVTVSGKLGNTPTVALTAYISPSVFSGWRMNAGV